jgi:ABC-type transport system involved in multi-copper enzyme maturation permease subunit
MTTIMRITLKETVRRRVLLVALLLTAAFLGLYGFGVHFAVQAVGEAGGAGGPVSGSADFLADLIPFEFFTLALFFGTFILGFLAMMSAVGSISLEVEDGIMHGVAPRPIRRSSIVLGKFLGYALMLAVFSAAFYIAIFLTTVAATGKPLRLSMSVLGLYVLHPMILLALAMFGSTFLSTIANAVAVFMLYALSIMGGTLEQFGYILRNEILINTGIVSSLLMPADSLYRKMVHLMLPGAGASLSSSFLGPFGSSGEPSVWMLLYAALYVIAFLALAVRTFSRRDI